MHAARSAVFTINYLETALLIIFPISGTNNQGIQIVKMKSYTTDGSHNMTHITCTGGPISPNLRISPKFYGKNISVIGPQYKRGAQCRRNFWAKNFRRYCPPCI
jgi:hypothetical protein